MHTLTAVPLAFACAALTASRDVDRMPPADARAVLAEVARAEAEYRTTYGRYTASLRALGIPRPADVDVRITAEGAGGYAAVALAASEECAVFHGSARPPRSYARTAGRIACRVR